MKVIQTEIVAKLKGQELGMDGMRLCLYPLMQYLIKKTYVALSFITSACSYTYMNTMHTTQPLPTAWGTCGDLVMQVRRVAVL